MRSRWLMLFAALPLFLSALACSKTCPRCEGKGTVTVTRSCEVCAGTGTVRRTCERCGGAGQAKGGGPCPYCSGTGKLPCRYRVGMEDRTQIACYVQGRPIFPKLTVVCRNGRMEGLTKEADEAYQQLSRSRVCPMCLGQGVRACSVCGGTGILKASGPCRDCNGTGQILEPCSACGGKGRFVEEEACPLCKGAGKVKTLLP